MLPNMFDSTSIPVLEQVVNFTQTRHNLLAGNIANLDTPGYRTRDLSTTMFQSRLQAAIETRDKTASAAPMSGAATSGTDPFSEVDDSLKSILYHDDSDVGIEHQITEMTKNQMQHNLALAIMNSQIHLLQAAVSERA